MVVVVVVVVVVAPARRHPTQTYILLTTSTYLLLAHLRGGTPPQLEPRHSTLCSFTMASTVALAAGQPRCAQAAVLGACSHEYG